MSGHPNAQTAEPSGCRWCGISERDHMQRWKAPRGWHEWEQPTQEQIKARMLARRPITKERR